MESATEVTVGSPPALLERPVAPVWRRAAARVLDALTVFFALWALAVMQVLWFFSDLSREVTPDPWGRAFLPTLLFVACLLAYEAFFVHANQGQTPGMDFCRIRVIGTDGSHPSPARCIARAVPGSLLWVVPPLWLGAALVASTGAPALVLTGGRSLQDLAGGTRLVPYDRVREDPDCPPTPKPFRRRRLSSLRRDMGGAP